MSDLRKSNVLRCILWLLATALIGFAVSIADAIIDRLPIWYLSQGSEHSFIECVVFWTTVAGAIWRWLCRRVWIGSILPPAHRAAADNTEGGCK